MKKLLSMLLVVLMVTAIMAGALTGCSKDSGNPSDVTKTDDPNNTDNPDVDEPSNEEPGEEDLSNGFTFNETDFQGQTLTTWTWWDVTLNKYQELFEEKTGAKLEYVNVPFENYQERFITAVSTGTGPDIILPEAYGIAWIGKGVVQPWDPYLDITQEPFVNKVAMGIIDYFTKDGKVYGVTAGEDPYFIYYNRQIIEDEGADDPFELWKAGNWNWNTFMELSNNLTVDRNNDGIMDVYGYDGWEGRSFALTNGGADISVIDGKPTYTMDDPRVVKAIEFSREIARPEGGEDDDPMKRFERGSVVMMGWGSWDLEKYREMMGDDLGIVPFPAGPDLDKSFKVAPGTVGVQPNCLATGAKSPELAAHYLTWSYWDKVNPEGDAATLAMYGSEEIAEMFREMRKVAVPEISTAFGDVGNADEGLLAELVWWNWDDTVANVTQAAKQAIQAEIDAALAD